MKKPKTILVMNAGKISTESIYTYSKLPYSKIVIFYTGKKDTGRNKIPSNIEIVSVEKQSQFSGAIKELYTRYPEHRIFPNFSGDANSKHAIKVYNTTFGSRIDAKAFKQKDMMTQFLGDLAKKRYATYSYKNLKDKTYEELAGLVGDNFIVKPINASSSTNTFKISSAEGFDGIKKKLSKNYEYIIEEYIGGNLFSLDFFFDGERMYLLVLAREVVMIELSDKNKFSEAFLRKYGEELQKHFNFILPLSYHIDFSKLSSTEIAFLEQIGNRLREIEYRGVIHLEYKYDPATKQIGFIEWGARYGGYRKIFIKEIYHTDILRVPYYLLVEKDTSRFKKLKGEVYCFKEKEPNLNFVRVKTNFIDTTYQAKILNKSGDILTNSFDSFLKEYYKDTFGIRPKKIDYFVKTSDEYTLHPFYKDSTTKFDYILELNDENFAIFRKKKFQIIEQVFFHDYKK